MRCVNKESISSSAIVVRIKMLFFSVLSKQQEYLLRYQISENQKNSGCEERLYHKRCSVDGEKHATLVVFVSIGDNTSFVK